jgi:putative FmdB family regulatory protein
MLAMPIYAYRCAACGHTKDVLRKMSDPPLADCPACGLPRFEKQVTAAGFQLKGSGWYVTDFRGDKKAAAAADADKAGAKNGEPAPAGAEKSAAEAAAKPEAGKPAADKTADSGPAAAPATTAEPAPVAAPSASPAPAAAPTPASDGG